VRLFPFKFCDSCGGSSALENVVYPCLLVPEIDRGSFADYLHARFEVYIEEVMFALDNV
jgi:hypothetical protein